MSCKIVVSCSYICYPMESMKYAIPIKIANEIMIISPIVISLLLFIVYPFYRFNLPPARFVSTYCYLLYICKYSCGVTSRPTMMSSQFSNSHPLYIMNAITRATYWYLQCDVLFAIFTSVFSPLIGNLYMNAKSSIKHPILNCSSSSNPHIVCSMSSSAICKSKLSTKSKNSKFSKFSILIFLSF